MTGGLLDGVYVVTAPIAVSIPTLARMLDLAPDMVRAAVNRGDLPARRIPPKTGKGDGTSIRVAVDDARTWFAALPAVHSP